QDWVIDPLAIYPSFSLAGVLDSLFILFVGPIPVAIIDRGLFADRYQAPDAPANDSSPNLIFADKLDPTAQAADIDYSQPFPVSGRINVGWFRCNNGGPYVAECAGASTSVKLSGSGSDPDGNP